MKGTIVFMKNKTFKIRLSIFIAFVIAASVFTVTPAFAVGMVTAPVSSPADTLAVTPQSTSVTGKISYIGAGKLSIITQDGTELEFYVANADKDGCYNLAKGEYATVYFVGDTADIQNAKVSRIEQPIRERIVTGKVVAIGMSAITIVPTGLQNSDGLSFLMDNVDTTAFRNLNVGQEVNLYYMGVLDEYTMQSTYALRIEKAFPAAATGKITNVTASTLSLATQAGQELIFNIANVDTSDCGDLAAGNYATVYFTGEATSSTQTQTVAISHIEQPSKENSLSGTIDAVGMSAITIIPTGKRPRDGVSFLMDGVDTSSCTALEHGAKVKLYYKGILTRDSALSAYATRVVTQS